MCMRVYVCVYIYVCVHIYIDEIRWCFLCLFLIFVVLFTQHSFSFSCVCFFFFPTSCFYLQGQSIFIRRISLQPALCSHLQCLPFYFCTKPQIYALAAGAQCSVAPMHVTQRNHQTDAVVPVTHYIQPSPKTLTFHFSPSIVTQLESFHRENQRLCSMSVMASWFFGIAPSFAGEPRIQQHPLSFRNLKGDRHIWGISLKSEQKPSVALSSPWHTATTPSQI